MAEKLSLAEIQWNLVDTILRNTFFRISFFFFISR